MENNNNQNKEKLNAFLKHFITHDEQLRAYTVDNTSNFLSEEGININESLLKKKNNKQKQKSTTFDYDFSFNLNFNKLFKEEIDIQVSEEFKEIYESDIICPTIGILGKANTGKTFLASKCFELCDDYKKAVIDHTPEIALKFVANNQVILMDTMGTGCALEKDQVNNQNEQTLNILREQFRNRFIMKYCGTIIYVIGYCDESEKQQYNNIKEANPHKLFVIHNLREIETQKELDNYIKNSITVTFDVNKFDVVSFDSAKTIYVEKDNPNYIHCIVGKWNSEELKVNNNKVISVLKEKILSDLNYNKFNVIDRTTEFLENFLIENFKLVQDLEESNVEISIPKKEQKGLFKVDIDVEKEKMKIQYQSSYSFTPNKFGSTIETFKCNSYRIYEMEPNKIIVEIDVFGPIDYENATIKGKQVSSTSYEIEFRAKYIVPKIQGVTYIANTNTNELFLANIEIPIEENISITNITNPNKTFDKGVLRIEYEYEQDNKNEEYNF